MKILTFILVLGTASFGEDSYFFNVNLCENTSIKTTSVVYDSLKIWKTYDTLKYYDAKYRLIS